MDGTFADFLPADLATTAPVGFAPAEEPFLPWHAGRLFAGFYQNALDQALTRGGLIPAGAAVLVVNARGGADVEAMARPGARVFALDPHAPALEAARKRAKLLGFYWEHLRATPEALPVRDRSVEFSLLRDGLGRVTDRERALGEMARVSRLAVIVMDRWATLPRGWFAARGWEERERRLLDLAPLPARGWRRGWQRPLAVWLGRAAARLARAALDPWGGYGILVAVRREGSR